MCRFFLFDFRRRFNEEEEDGTKQNGLLLLRSVTEQEFTAVFGGRRILNFPRLFVFASFLKFSHSTVTDAPEMNLLALEKCC